MRGLILFAHGARDPAWAGPLERLRERLRAAAPDTPAELAFLDIMTPDLPTAAERLITGGCRSVVVVPIFFGQGGHVKRDLAALIGEVAARHPGWRSAARSPWARRRRARRAGRVLPCRRPVGSRKSGRRCLNEEGG
jgi:sirohydrochlorin cobaltochelatase